MILVDAYLDLSMNALNWDRDLELDVHTLLKRHQGQHVLRQARGGTAIGKPSWADSASRPY